MLEMPMSELLDKVPLDRETKAVLLGQLSMLRLVYKRLFSIAERHFSVSRVRFRTCGNVLLCKTPHALRLRCLA
jgi:hypothetical protein